MSTAAQCASREPAKFIAKSFGHKSKRKHDKGDMLDMHDKEIVPQNGTNSSTAQNNPGKFEMR